MSVSTKEDVEAGIELLFKANDSIWNPKHTLPEELKRIQRLCSQVTQRHRDFGNFAGLHLNWYPRAFLIG
jgi:hypothetical protein